VKKMISPLVWIVGGIAVLALAGLGAWFILSVTLNNWGASQVEINQPLPGDSYVSRADRQRTKAITIHAPVEGVYPWIVQLGQEKGGFYSYSGFENLIGCNITNAERIYPEWQAIQPGDLVRMYPKDKGGPPPYIVVSFTPNQAVVLGHHADGGEGWNDTWQFVLVALDDYTTRLILRDRMLFIGVIWDAMTPGFDVMEVGMLQGIRQRAEGT